MTANQVRQQVLFICTHNAARSQMAEGLLNSILGEFYSAQSAGSNPTHVSPYAVKVMAEIGIDISGQRSKGVDEFKNTSFDYVVTVCDHAKESCPFFPAAKIQIHHDFENPSELTGTEEEILAGYRRIRDLIRQWITSQFQPT
ncbi:MAG: arsenate reductase ArsC [candidate division Zixibacteria bacterium]|nr:arsenate reductase ArsC [candidate division Zixibacteria bacterium]